MRNKTAKHVLFFTASGCVIAMLFGLLMLLSILSTYTAGAELTTALTQHITVPQPLEQQACTPDDPAEEPAAREEFTLPYWVTLPEVDFEALRAINPNVVAWIIVNGTPINHPVVQGTNNYHYLNHLFDGRRGATGTIFKDTYNRPGFVDDNSILYGHHMQDGSMFAALLHYESQAFFDAHPWGFLLTPTGNYALEFFAGHTTTVASPSWRIQFADDIEMQHWLAETRAQSYFHSDLDVQAHHRIVTLATCTTSWEFSDARFVLLARLLPVAAH